LQDAPPSNFCARAHSVAEVVALPSLREVFKLWQLINESQATYRILRKYRALVFDVAACRLAAAANEQACASCCTILWEMIKQLNIVAALEFLLNALN
jgi:hypothetical protein